MGPFLITLLFAGVAFAVLVFELPRDRNAAPTAASLGACAVPVTLPCVAQLLPAGAKSSLPC